MRQFSTLLLALGLSATCAMSQNVTVFMKDNTTHKFNAEYLSEIKFRDVTPSPDEILFKTIDLNVYGGGNVEVTMTNEAGDVSCKADLYGSSDAVFLEKGVYDVAGTSAPFTVNPGYSKVTIGDENYNITGGQVTVQIGIEQPTSSILRSADQDHNYVINVNLTLENGKNFYGTYTGELPSYTPWIQGVMSDAKYNVNPQPRGQFYVKFNDADWKYDMALVFVAEAGDSRLPAGTYTLSDFASPGSLLSASYVESYGPNFNAKLMPGSKVTVQENNGTYTMDMDLTLSNGVSAQFSFEGQISGEPLFDDPTPEGVEYPELVVQPYGGGNTTLIFFSEGNIDQVSLDCYGTPTTTYFEPGVYTIGGSTEPFIDTDKSYTFYCEDYQNPDHPSVQGLKSGALTVTLEDDVYTFVLDAVLDNDENLKFWHKGVLSTFGKTINMELSAASYNENPRPAGNFYVKFNDAGWKCDVALDLYASPSATLLPAGTYTYSTEKTPGTFSNISYVEMFSPSSYNRMTEGSRVTVTVDEVNVYHFDMNLLFEDGRTAHMTYEGQISGTPVFESTDPQGEEYLLGVAQPFGGGNTTILLYNNEVMTDYTKMISLDTYGSSDATYFEPGVYTIGASEEPSIDTDAYYTFYAVKDEEGINHKTALKSGKLTVTLEGVIYTLALDAVLDDADSTPLQAWYRGKLEDFGPEIKIDLTAASYNENPLPAGNFYVKFHDASWKCEMALDMYTDKSATLLPAGQYTYSAEHHPGTFGPLSYVDLFSPNSNNRMKEGSMVDVTVDENGIYHFEMNLLFEDGRTAIVNYEGQISGTPVFEEPEAIELECPVIDIETFSNGNATLKFSTEDGSASLNLDCYGSVNTTYFEPGVYVIGGSERPYIDTNASYTFYLAQTGKQALKSGTLTVSLDEAEYTFVLEAELEDGTPIKMNSTGELPKYGKVLNLTMSAAEYSSNPRPKGDMYIKMHNADYSCEMALDIWFYPFTNRLYATAQPFPFKQEPGTPETFSGDSYVDLFNPTTNNRMKEGSTVEVEETGSNGSSYKIIMHFLFEDGRTANITYEGPVTGSPVFE